LDVLHDQAGHLKEDKAGHQLASTLTDFFVLFFSIGCLAVLGLVWWVNLGQWPDTLRILVVVVTCAAGLLFVFLRRRSGVTSQAQAGEVLTIPVSSAVILLLLILFAAALMAWAFTQPGR
jgi:ABC-type Mn2+/Zn2+ transport system permease subunit